MGINIQLKRSEFLNHLGCLVGALVTKKTYLIVARHLNIELKSTEFEGTKTYFCKTNLIDFPIRKNFTSKTCIDNI